MMQVLARSSISADFGTRIVSQPHSQDRSTNTVDLIDQTDLASTKFQLARAIKQGRIPMVIYLQTRSSGFVEVEIWMAFGGTYYVCFHTPPSKRGHQSSITSAKYGGPSTRVGDC